MKLNSKLAVVIAANLIAIAVYDIVNYSWLMVVAHPACLIFYGQCVPATFAYAVAVYAITFYILVAAWLLYKSLKIQV